MASRKYDQRLRAEHAEETRHRILDAVYERLREAPTEPLALDEIARLAKVARSTIYQVFGSRAGLFDAFADDLWARSGLPALTEAVANPDARGHLRGGIGAASRMYAADRDIYRILYSMAQLDPDSVGGAVRKMNKERQGGMTHLAHRLDEDGVLRPDVSVDEAVDVLWMLCSFESFDLLYTGRELSTERAVELITAAAERTLCVAEPAGGSSTS
jgi:AcrR family transcriptional regulator